MKNSIKHIAIIPDGNGRWATKHNVPKSQGHKAGAENVKKLSRLRMNME
ncbi:MAG UNVERIFIED_CONTAM: undecaprenyl diphosphate synthase family protein [Rickettsiaceae bacterium]|jgi:undecaprenyl diphosphate synthase